MENIITKQFKNPIIFNPVDHVVYMDNGRPLDDSYVYSNPIMNAKGYSLAAAAKQDDPLRITEMFYNNGTEETNFSDYANGVYSKLNKSKETGDRDLAAAIITSKEFTTLQDTVVLGTNEELIRTGILTQLFEDVATTTLTGKYFTFANDLKYMTNLPESKSPEPTMGGVSTTTIEVPKHGGAVAITDRARQVINLGPDVFSRFVGQLQLKRALSESTIVRDAIEAIASTNNQAGVDFGVRSGSPPASTTNPIDTLIKIVDFFDGTNGIWNGFVSNALPYYEYINNDLVRGGTSNPINPVGTINESQGPFPLASGVTWFRDNLMTTLTEGYAFDRTRAGKNFRGPTRAYTVTDPDTETEKYVTKSHFACIIVDGTVIARVTGIQA